VAERRKIREGEGDLEVTQLRRGQKKKELGFG